MKIYFTTYNLNDIEIAKDFFSYYLDNFKDHEINFSNKIEENHINIVLEEFSDDKVVENFINIKKKYPKTIFYLLFSEHITNDSFMGYSFNYFKKMNFFEKLIFLNRTEGKFDNFFEKIIKIKSKLKIKDKTIEDMKKFLIKWFLIDMNEIDYNIYMKKRYSGFQKIKEIFDSIIVLDERDKIEIQEYLGKSFNEKVIMILPKANLLMHNENFGISISGSVTKYKINFLDQIIKKIKIKNNFEDFKKNKVLFLKRNSFPTYGLHIPKNKYWKFHSILKYILSIRNNEIPIISKKIEGRIGNLLCFYVKDFSSLNNKNVYEKFLININKKIKNYNLYYEKHKKEFRKFLNKDKN